MPSPPCHDTDPHEVISSYFIGPKAENLPVFQENLITILNELKNTRLAYHENDEVCNLPLTDITTFANVVPDRYLSQKKFESLRLSKRSRKGSTKR